MPGRGDLDREESRMKVDVIRAWKDPSYRTALSEAERAQIPVNPAGLVDLSDEELKEASGLNSMVGTTAMKCTDTYVRFHCCPG
jgi:mersacidin/lichenicidin family type 2 lantibiotic